MRRYFQSFIGHFETIIPSYAREEDVPFSTSDTIRLDDGDSLEVFLSERRSNHVVILTHGLESEVTRGYLAGMANTLFQSGHDVVGWNMRSCGGSESLGQKFYHAGAYEDLEAVVEYVINQNYESISLLGFSLGGSITLNFAADSKLKKTIKSAVAISTPLDLFSSSRAIHNPLHYPYVWYFLKTMRRKAKEKAEQTGIKHFEGADKIWSIREFDDHITAPIHGFQNVRDYYTKCSAINKLEKIERPTLIINAKNDPFLGEECYPKEVPNPLIETVYPSYGGHMGFYSFKDKNYHHEFVAKEFLSTFIGKRKRR